MAGSLRGVGQCGFGGEARSHGTRRHPQHGMIAVKGVRIDRLGAIAQEHGLAVAIVNDEQHAVLAGPTAVMKSICKGMERELGAHVVRMYKCHRTLCG